MSEWITDRKPTKFGVYLVTLPDENSSGTSRFVDIETFDPEDGWDSLYKVLAWQELPKPYDGEIKEEYIPIHWITKWVEEHSSFLKTNAVVNPKDFISMILDWEKENGKSNIYN